MLRGESNGGLAPPRQAEAQHQSATNNSNFRQPAELTYLDCAVLLRGKGAHPAHLWPPADFLVTAAGALQTAGQGRPDGRVLIQRMITSCCTMHVVRGSSQHPPQGGPMHDAAAEACLSVPAVLA